MEEIKKITEERVQIDPLDVETTFVNISQLFDKQRKYRVPNYQRGYAWQDKQVNALWKDIFNIFNEDKSKRNKSSTNLHYMGVLAIDETKRGEYEIVDGQQRITTIIFLIKALIIRLKEFSSEDICESLSKKYIKSDKISYKFEYYKESGENEFLKEYVYNSVEDFKEKIDNLYKQNIYNSFNNLKRKVNNLSQEEIKSIIDIVENRLVFNLYKNAQGIDVKKTFESMNNRGKELSKLELLKNRLIYLSSKIQEEDEDLESLYLSLTEEIDNTWKKIYCELGNNINSGVLKDDEFLKAHWIGYRRHFKDKKGTLGDIKAKGDTYAYEILDKVFVESLYDEEKEEIIVEPVTYDKIYNYVKSLSDCSELWTRVKNPKVKDDDEESKRLDRLSRIRNFIYVDALVLATLYRRGEISLDKRLHLYEVLEKYIFINFGFYKVGSNDMSFCNSYTQELYLYDADNADNISKETVGECMNYNKKPLDNVIDELIDKLENTHEFAIRKTLDVSGSNDNNVFNMIEQHVNQSYYDKMYQCRYLLYEYNIRSKEAKNYDKEFFNWGKFKKTESIEHILPQSNVKFSRGSSGKIARKKLPMSWQSVIMKNDNKILVADDDIALESVYSETELTQITNSLGNLVAIVNGAKNSHLSNKSFAIKLEQYKLGTIREREISGKYKHWTIKEIYDRTNEILDFVYEEWFKGYINKEDFDKQKAKMIGWEYDDNKIPYNTLVSLLDKLYVLEKTEEEDKREIELDKQNTKDALYNFIISHKDCELIKDFMDKNKCKALFNREKIVLKERKIDKVKGDFENDKRYEYEDYCLDFDKKIEINGKYFVFLDDWADTGLKKIKEILEHFNK